MKPTGKENIKIADNKAPEKEFIEEADAKLTDDELDQVSGGHGTVDYNDHTGIR